MPEPVLRTATQSSSLADILERVLDKGVVIAGDINIQLVGVDLLNIRVRLLVASVDKAMQMGINWWENDPNLSTRQSERVQELEAENRMLRERLDRLERMLTDSGAVTPDALSRRGMPTATEQ